MPRETTERQSEGEIIRLIEESHLCLMQLFARRCRNRSSRFQLLETGELEKVLPIKISVRESTFLVLLLRREKNESDTFAVCNTDDIAKLLSFTPLQIALG